MTTPTSLLCLIPLFPSREGQLKAPYHTRENSLPKTGTNYLSPIYQSSSRPTTSSVKGIISWCPINRIQIASDSANVTSPFLSASRIHSDQNDSTANLVVIENLDLRKIEPKSVFHLGFAWILFLFWWEHRYFYRRYNNSLNLYFSVESLFSLMFYFLDAFHTIIRSFFPKFDVVNLWLKLLLLPQNLSMKMSLKRLFCRYHILFSYCWIIVLSNNFSRNLVRWDMLSLLIIKIQEPRLC